MNNLLRILLIENSSIERRKLEKVLSGGGFQVYTYDVSSLEDFYAALNTQQWDVVIFDYENSGFEAMSALKTVKETGVEIPFVIISSKADGDIAVKLMNAGAHDFVSSCNLSRLIPIVKRELSETESRFRQKAFEMELARSEEKYRQLAESITDVFFALDKNLCCTYWNKAAEILTGISLKSALAQPFLRLFPEDPGHEIEESLSEVINNREQIALSFTLNLQGVARHYEMDIYPTENGLSVLARDISFRKKADILQKSQEEINSQLAQAQELRLLGQLTSGVAHEVRNPLNAISVVLEALFQDIGDNPEYRLYREHLFTHVDRLKRLMQDLLELGRPIERSKVTTLDIEDLISETVDMWKTSGPHNHFDVSIHSYSDSGIRVKGDPLKLQQVFMNLLENASQHSSNEKIISIAITEREDSCEIKLSDRGDGVKLDHLSKIFDPFFTTRKRGTGLGLSIVKHIIDVHGGAITIENNQSMPGCTVTVLLPRSKKAKKSIQNDIESSYVSSFVV